MLAQKIKKIWRKNNLYRTIDKSYKKHLENLIEEKQ